MKKVKAALIILLPVLAYLYFAYSRVYNFIGTQKLMSPFIEKTISLKNPAQTAAATYVVLGDSLASGIGSANVRYTYPYQHALKLLTKHGEITVTNLAVPGATALDVLEQQVPLAIKSQPEYISVLVGVNDLHNRTPLEKFETNYTGILTSLLNQTSAQLTVLNMPYLGSEKLIYPPYNFLLNYRNKQFNKTLATIIATLNNPRLTYVDLYSATYPLQKQNPDYYSQDLFHPSEKAYILWGNILNAY